MHKNVMNTLANHIREHRKQADLSQAELAQYAGVSKTVVFDLEHAKSTVQFLSILKVLNVLNIDISFTSPSIKEAENNNATS